MKNIAQICFVLFNIFVVNMCLAQGVSFREQIDAYCQAYNSDTFSDEEKKSIENHGQSQTVIMRISKTAQAPLVKEIIKKVDGSEYEYKFFEGFQIFISKKLGEQWSCPYFPVLLEVESLTKDLYVDSVLSKFTGRIYAEYFENKSTEKDKINVIFTIAEDAIQRVEYVADDVYKGVVIYPLKKEAVVFRREKLLRYYAVVSLEEYKKEISGFDSKPSLKSYEKLGFSAHFLYLNKGVSRSKTNIDKGAEYDGKSCDNFEIIKSEDESGFGMSVIHCHHLGIPRSWLDLVELNIPDDVSGFPFHIVKEKKDRANNQDESNKRIKTPVEKDSIIKKISGFVMEAISKNDPLVYELEEFTYRVTKVKYGGLYRQNFSIWKGFTRVDDISSLRKSFSDYPIDSKSRTGGSSFWD